MPAAMLGTLEIEELTVAATDLYPPAATLVQGGSLGHLGFFRKRFRESWGQDSAAWLRRTAEGA